MQINVAQLLQTIVGTTRDYQVSESVDVAGDGNARLVQGEVNLLRTHRSIVAQVALHTDVELACSRCLSQFTYGITLNFEEENIPTVDVLSGAPLPSPEEAGAFTIDGHHVIDLTEAIRQYTALAIPMKPLCKEGCAGLCPSCGHNLNRETCDCTAQEVDPRWSELTKLV